MSRTWVGPGMPFSSAALARPQVLLGRKQRHGGRRRSRNESALPPGRNFPVERLWRDADLLGDRLPLASCGQIALVPGQPGVEPSGDRAERDDLRTPSCLLEVVRHLRGPRTTELNVRIEQLSDGRDGIGFGLSIGRSDGVTVVALRKHRGFSHDVADLCALQHGHLSIRLVSHELDGPAAHEVHEFHLVVAVKEESTRWEVAPDGVQCGEAGKKRV